MGEATLRIHNMLGQQVRIYSMNFGRLVELDLEGLPNGTYVISIENEQTRYSQKVMKY